jgi:carboxyl-terminal processing protease
MTKRTSRVAFAATTVAALLLLVPAITWAKKANVFSQIELLVDIRHEIVSEYVEEPDQTKMAENAVKGMVEALNDPYTIYLPPQEVQGFEKQIRGTFFGIGAEVDVHDNRLRIVSPLEGSPAWKAGVMAGDTVLEIDGVTTLGMKINDAIGKLTGPEGTQVKLKVRHESGEEALLTITRAKINVQTVKGLRRAGDLHWDFMLDHTNKIGYVRITQFTETTADDLREAMKQLVGKDVKALILDVRFDPGGLLEAAAEIADLYLKQGQRIVSIKGRRVPERVMEARTDNSPLEEIPLVIIANESSASASEILTGALSDNNRAQFIGTRTFGKGSVQQVKMLEGGEGAIKITNAYYYLPNGRNIHRRETSEVWGVDPQDGFYVPMSNEQVKQMIDKRRSGDVLRANAATQPAVTPEYIETELADLQLAAAVRAAIGKLQTGQWPKVGKGNVGEIVKLAEKQKLVKRKEAIEKALADVNKTLARLDDPKLSAEEALKAGAGKGTSTQPSTQPDDDDDDKP